MTFPTQSWPSFLNHLDFALKSSSSLRHFVNAVLSIHVRCLKYQTWSVISWSLRTLSRNVSSRKEKNWITVYLYCKWKPLFLISKISCLCPATVSHCWRCCLVPNNHNNVCKGYYSDYSQLVCLSLLIFLVSHHLFAFTLVITECFKKYQSPNDGPKYPNMWMVTLDTSFWSTLKLSKKVTAIYKLYKD